MYHLNCILLFAKKLSYSFYFHITFHCTVVLNTKNVAFSTITKAYLNKLLCTLLYVIFPKFTLSVFNLCFYIIQNCLTTSTSLFANYK